MLIHQLTGGYYCYDLHRFVDMVMTIPKGTLFPMCGMNLAFDRSLIGPAMYFGLMGDGQPIGRYDDMWAGWCCKETISLHLLHTCASQVSFGNICSMFAQFSFLITKCKLQETQYLVQHIMSTTLDQSL